VGDGIIGQAIDAKCDDLFLARREITGGQDDPPAARASLERGIWFQVRNLSIFGQFSSQHLAEVFFAARSSKAKYRVESSLEVPLPNRKVLPTV
jgi:hypothetical protein